MRGRTGNQKIPAIALIVGVLLLFAALPADAATGATSGILSAFSQVVTGWYGKILTVSEEIFFTLFGIDFVYLVAQWMIGGKDVHEILTSFVKKLITIGFWYTLLLHSQQFLHWVYGGFKQTGVEAGGAVNVTASSLLGEMMKIWTELLQGPYDAKSHGFLYDISHVGSIMISGLLGDLLGLFTALVMLFIVVYMVIEFFTVQLEAMLVGSIGAILLGFAGSRWTVQHADGFIKYALSVGVRLLVLTLWMGFITKEIPQSIELLMKNSGLGHESGTHLAGLFELYGEILVFFLLVGWLTKKLPGIAASVLSGSSSLGGGELMGAAVGGAALAAGGAAVLATGGAALAAGGASGAMTASEAVAASGGVGGAGEMGAAAGNAAETAGGGAGGMGNGLADSGMADTGNASSNSPASPAPVTEAETESIRRQLARMKSSDRTASSTGPASGTETADAMRGEAQPKPEQKPLHERAMEWIDSREKDAHFVEQHVVPGEHETVSVSAEGNKLSHSE
ncbi:P-type conjugative transfer protein TrbL [Acidithiobacillus sulfurivorans]|uniref:P-type conjugative transfer protein TrbL n=1 Tax=Acidithiobacillus sulfurivorans TaxID=1958756 RepID=A0ABS6A114_9PROT|nr:P-type conjugative transfer protein TrbL [Acidithiobacillus sulfurivorans]MBU2761095.1 P-type conjugative transfer protein TrbL [Acidithiobacillus sulfurivorans]